MQIQPIVEGHADVDALPVPLRRIAAELGRADVVVRRPMRIPRSKLPRTATDSAGAAELARAVRLASTRLEGTGCVLLVLDSDNDCPATFGPLWLAMRKRKRLGLSAGMAVVLAHHEYEAWFLGALTSLRGHRGVRSDAAQPPRPGGRQWGEGIPSIPTRLGALLF